MTREDIVNAMSLKDAIQVFRDTNCYGTMDIAKTVILRALEQEPNVDMESEEIKNLQKRAYLEGFHEALMLAVNEEGVKIADAINNLPSATPKEPKTGRWINGDSICPCCGEDKYKDLDADAIWADWQPKYCPNCGAKMESEEQE